MRIVLVKRSISNSHQRKIIKRINIFICCWLFILVFFGFKLNICQFLCSLKTGPLVSISSTFCTCIFFVQKYILQSQNVTRKSCAKHFRRQKLLIKRWWSWHLGNCLPRHGLATALRNFIEFIRFLFIIIIFWNYWLEQLT